MEHILLVKFGSADVPTCDLTASESPDIILKVSNLAVSVTNFWSGYTFGCPKSSVNTCELQLKQRHYSMMVGS